MKKLYCTILILSLMFSLFHLKNFSLSCQPTVYTNNEVLDEESKINKLSNDISTDNLNYTFKRDEILNNIEKFKNTLIDNINMLITNNDYENAYNTLIKYYYLYTKDLQINNLKNHLESALKNNNLEIYTGNIETLSIKPLLSYPKQVLVKKNNNATKLDENHITTTEFEKILLELYNRNYVLIKPSSLYNIKDNIIDKAPLLLPKNKKPLLLILEDTEYNIQSNGSVDRLIIDRNDKIATYTPKRSINDRIHYDNDFVTILEQFLNNHPSFSHKGARALLCIDGSKGIFGYKTQKTNATSRYEIKKATKIITYLKSKGYEFCSSGYKHKFNDNDLNFASSLSEWQEQVSDIVNPSPIFFLNCNLETLSEDIEYKSNLLNTYNYHFFIGLDFENKFEYSAQLDGIYLTAKPINGKTLRYSEDSLAHLFDCEKIYDHINRFVTFTSD